MFFNAINAYTTYNTRKISPGMNNSLGGKRIEENKVYTFWVTTDVHFNWMWKHRERITD